MVICATFPVVHLNIRICDTRARTVSYEHTVNWQLTSCNKDYSQRPFSPLPMTLLCHQTAHPTTYNLRRWFTPSVSVMADILDSATMSVICLSLNPLPSCSIRLSPRPRQAEWGRYLWPQSLSGGGTKEPLSRPAGRALATNSPGSSRPVSRQPTARRFCFPEVTPKVWPETIISALLNTTVIIGITTYSGDAHVLKGMVLRLIERRALL